MVNICVSLSTDSSWRNWGSERQHDFIQLSITHLSLTPKPILCVCVHVCVCACAHMCVIYMYFYLSTCGSQRTLPNVLSLSAHLFLLRIEHLTECGDRVGTSTPQRISCLCPRSPCQHWGYRHPGSYECWGSELRSLFLNNKYCCPLSHLPSAPKPILIY